MDETTSYLRSNIEKNEKITGNKIHLSELLNSPNGQYNLYAGNTKRYKNKEMRNRPNRERYCHLYIVTHKIHFDNHFHH